ncbi:MAG: TonB-dependent receptor [Deltaproteobacteria bacterium]|nr:MAG: TonB-dependent receptor [Deltaproteobacteria bacterium]
MTLIQGKSMRLVGRIGVLALAALLPSLAFADPKDDARRHFVAGLEAAKAEQFEVALQHFLAAQDAFPHPATLYNIARTYTDLGDYQNALTYYRLFRDLDPSRADEVDPVIDAIQMRLAQRTAPTTVTQGTPTQTTGGGGGGEGLGTIVVSGATDEEMARIDALTAELEALSTSIKERMANPPIPEPIPGDPTTGGELPDVDPEELPPSAGGEGSEIPNLPGGGYAEAAYERQVVTASRYGQDPLDSPSTLTVVTGEDIRIMGATSLREIFRRVPGFEVAEFTVGNAPTSIRGFNDELSNKILILIDGRSTYEDYLGTTFKETFPVALDEIERIEIIRGPGSAVYGANAVTGVVNIITRTPGEGGSSVRIEAGNSARLDPQGFGGYTRGEGVTSGRSGDTAYRLSAGFKTYGRWEKDFEAGDFASHDLYQQDQDIGLVNLKAHGRIDRTFLAGDGFASVSGGFSDTDLEFQNQGVLNTYGARFKTHYLRGDLAYGPVHLRAFWNSSYSNDIDRWADQVDHTFPVAFAVDADVFDVELEGNQEIKTGPVVQRVNAGISYRMKQLQDFAFVGQTPEPQTAAEVAECTARTRFVEMPDGSCGLREHHFGFFLQDEVTMRRFKVVLSGRFDRDPNIDPKKTLSPRASFIARIADQTSLRANIGSSFRAPNMIENYSQYALPTGTDGVFLQFQADHFEKVQPERILTAELGVHDQSTLYHSADVAIYYNRLVDRIDIRDVEPTLEFYDFDIGGYRAGFSAFENIPLVDVGYGLEAEAEFYPTDGLDVYTNFTIAQHLWLEDGTRTRSEEISTFKGNLGASYRTPYRTDVSLDVNYVGRQAWGVSVIGSDGLFRDTVYEVPARLFLNSRVGVRPFEDEKLEFALVGYNLLGFSKPFIEHPKGQRVGGRLFGSVSYKF